MASGPPPSSSHGSSSLPLPLRQELQLDNNFNQSRVCSTYNGHDNEAYKVKYWADLVSTVLQYEGGVATTCTEIRKWWARHVNPHQTLPSLPAILAASSDLRTETEADRECAALWSTSDATTADADTAKSGLMSKITGLAMGLLWSRGGTACDGKESVSDNTIVFSVQQLSQLGARVLRRASSYDNSVLTLQEFDLIVEEELTAMRVTAVEFGLSVQAGGKARGAVLAYMASVDKASAFCDAVGAASEMLRGVKVGSPTPATPAEKAHLVHRIALERIDTMEVDSTGNEESLTAGWSKADGRAREHLRAGRKPLALQALKERSLLQGRLDELGKYRLQLQSTSGVTATAEIQSIVVEALSASTMMAKKQKVHLDQVDQLAEDMQEVREDIDLVSDAIAAMSLNGGTAAAEEDPELQAELDKIMEEQRDIDVVTAKAQVVAAPSVPTEAVGAEPSKSSTDDSKADSTASSPSRLMMYQPV